MLHSFECTKIKCIAAAVLKEPALLPRATSVPLRCRSERKPGVTVAGPSAVQNQSTALARVQAPSWLCLSVRALCRIPLVLFRTGFRNTIYDVLKSKYGWKETDSDTDWDFIWADVGWIRDYYDHVHLDDHQRVNHFRNHYELTRKDLLVKNVNRMKKQVRRCSRARMYLAA